MKEFQSVQNPKISVHEVKKGKKQTIPNQVATITEVVYRFQGGIIPDVRNAYYDTMLSPDNNEIHVSNQSGFDITEAFRLSQEGKQKYQEYINEKKRNIREQVEREKEELIRLREQVKNVNQQSQGDDINNLNNKNNG